ncbi:MAG: hypothetical protein FWB86_10215 [Treponema sp.]|nr:hypothetical protein [Treponema sp.]
MNKKRKIFIIILTVLFIWCFIGAYLIENSAIPIVIAVYAIILFLTGEGSKKKKAAIVLMVIPVFISFTQGFSHTKTIFFVFRSTTYYSIAPSLLSTLAGVFLYLSIVVRGRVNLFKNAYETVIVVLNVLFCASFLEIFFPKEPWIIPFLGMSSQSFLLMAIVFSWIGMRALAGFLWIGLFLMALGRIVGLNLAMGLWGVVYIISAFVSIGLQLKDHVHLLSDFKNDFIGISSRVAEDSKLSISETKEAIKKVASIAATATTGVPINLPENEK